MNYLESLYKVIKNRAFQIDCEIQLLQEQFFFMDNLRGMDDRIKRLVFFKYSTLDAIHSIYEYYLENIQENLNAPCPFKKAMQYHFTAICTLFNPELIRSFQQDKQKKEDYHEKTQKCLITIRANQDAIIDLLGFDLHKCNESIENLMDSLYFLFPYLEIISFITEDNKFFTNLIKIAYEYDCSIDKRAKSHVTCLRQVYKLFPSNWQNYNPQIVLAISEVLLSIFTFQQENQSIQNNLDSFEISERCKYLIKRNLGQLSIKSDFITIIEKNLGYQHPIKPKDEEAQKKEIQENVIKIKPLEYVNDSYSPIMCIHHVVLELRKLPLQPSVSLMCFVLMRTMNFLNSALCTEGKFVGADESFQFFVAGLADARLYHLPKILDQMKTFIVSDLTVGKISFLISQLECAIDFIKTRILPVPQYILFPFKRDDIKLLHLVTRDELKNSSNDLQPDESSNNIGNSESDQNNNATDVNSNNENANSNSESTKISGVYSYVDIQFDSDSKDDDELILTGFKICAFPTFLRGKGQIPAILLCTGDIRDKAVVYRYTLNSINNIEQVFQQDLGPSFQTYGCIHGILYHMNKRSDYRGLIYINQFSINSEDNNQDFSNYETIIDYNSKVEDIAEFSNLMLMLSDSSSPSNISPNSKFLSTLPPINQIPGIKFGGYALYPEMLLLSNLPRFKENFKMIWKPQRSKSDNEKSTSDDHSTSSAKYYHQFMYKNGTDGTMMNLNSFNIIKEIQLILQKAGKLSTDYDPKGIIDKETVYALASCSTQALTQNFVLSFANYVKIRKALK